MHPKPLTCANTRKLPLNCRSRYSTVRAGSRCFATSRGLYAACQNGLVEDHSEAYRRETLRLVVEAEHLPDLLLGKDRRGIRDRFKEHLGVAHVASRVSSPADRHRPFPQGGARRSVGESGNDDKAVALPRLPLEVAQGRHGPPP